MPRCSLKCVTVQVVQAAKNSLGGERVLCWGPWGDCGLARPRVPCPAPGAASTLMRWNRSGSAWAPPAWGTMAAPAGPGWFLPAPACWGGNLEPRGVLAPAAQAGARGPAAGATAGPVGPRAGSPVPTRPPLPARLCLGAPGTVGLRLPGEHPAAPRPRRAWVQTQALETRRCGRVWHRRH